MKLPVFFFPFCLLFAFYILADTNLYAQDVAQDPKAQYITSFSFQQFSGGIIMLKAALNDHKDSLNFILDTGCSGISLDSSTVASLQLKVTPSNMNIKGIGGIRKVNFTHKNTLKLPGLEMKNISCHINDYELLTSVYGERIAGIIGYTFFSRYIVMINYDSNQIHVYQPGYLKYPPGGLILKPSIRTIPVEKAILKETEYIVSRFYVDIGAGMCLLLSTAFTEDSLQFSKDKKFFNTQVEGVGGKAEMKITILNEFRLGPYKFKKMPVYIFDDQYNVTEYPQLGGLLGNDLLRRFNAIFNYSQNQIYLRPNRHFRDKFDYSYTGMGFYYFDGAVHITDVMAGSPSDKAGFLVGDIIIGMNNSFKADIQTYKSILTEAGRKIRVIVIRDGKILEIKMKIGDVRKG